MTPRRPTPSPSPAPPVPGPSPSGAPAPAPAATDDAYSLRLLVGRKLSTTGHACLRPTRPRWPAWPRPSAATRPEDLDRLGVGVADQVTEVHPPARGDHRPAVADRAIAAGTAALAFPRPGADAAALVDVTAGARHRRPHRSVTGDEGVRADGRPAVLRRGRPGRRPHRGLQGVITFAASA